MYLAFGIGENAVGIVENGKIIGTVASGASIGEVVSGEAWAVQSDRVGTRVKANELVQVVGRDGEYKVSRQNGRTIRVPESKPVESITFTTAGV